MKLKKIALAVGLASCVAAGTSQATVLATAMIEMDNFVLKGSDGEILDYGDDFSSISYTSTADWDITFDSATDSQTNPGSTTGVDLTHGCLGASCDPIGENMFPVISGAGLGNFAGADQIEEGSPLANHPGLDVGARVANISAASIETGEHAASANSNNNLNANWTFELTQDTGITFEFDYRAYLEAYVTADEQSPGFATANYAFYFEIVDLSAGGTSVFKLEPDLLNHSISLNAPLPFDIQSTGGLHTIGTATVGSLSVSTDTLTAGKLYQLSARINTNADVSRIPEPAALLLMGAGLLGMGAARRKRKAA